MNKMVRVGIAFACLFLVGGQDQARDLKAQEPPATQQYFRVWLEQDGKKVMIKDHAAALKKGSFTIVLVFDKPRGVLVNFSFQDQIYQGFRKGQKLVQIIENPEEFMGIAEDPKSPEDIIIDTVMPHYFYYKNEQDHRFSKVLKEKSSIICKRNVSYYREGSYDSPRTSMRDIQADDLYISLLYGEYNDKGDRVEKQTEAIHLLFGDYAALFPSPLKGWSASDVRAEKSNIMEMALFGASGTRLKLDRTYSGLNHPGKLKIFMDSSDMVTSALISTAQESPDVASVSRKAGWEPFRHETYKGLKMYDEKKRLKGIVLDMPPSGIFRIEGETFRGSNDVMDYLEACDLKKIQAFLERVK